MCCYTQPLYTMDYRLDLFNAVERFQEQMTEDDALFIICHNSKQGDLLLGLDGEVNLISSVLANDNFYVNIENKEQKLRHEQAKRMVLNMAINILRTDEDLRKKFVIGMQSL
jgi:hypothetical protein